MTLYTARIEFLEIEAESHDEAAQMAVAIVEDAPYVVVDVTPWGGTTEPVKVPNE